MKKENQYKLILIFFIVLVGEYIGRRINNLTWLWGQKT